MKNRLEGACGSAARASTLDHAGFPGFGFVLLSPQRVVLDTDATTRKILARSRQELEGMSWDALVFEPDLLEEIEHINAFLEFATCARESEIRLVRADGSLVPVVVSIGTPLGHERGEQGILLIIRDITRLNEAEQLIGTQQRLLHAQSTLPPEEAEEYLGDLASEQQLLDLEREREHSRLALEASLDGFFRTDASGNLVESNDRLESMLRVSAGGLEGRSAWELFTPVTRNEVRDRIRTLRGTSRARFEAQLDRSTGGALDVEISARLLGTDDHSFVAFVRDVSRERHVKQRLEESERRFRGTFEAAAIGIAHVGLDGSWLRVNRNLCDIVGYDRAELAKLTFQDITHPDDLDADLDLFEQLKSGEIPTYTMDKRYFHKQGHIVWIRLTTAMQRDARGEIDYCISVIEDITERKALEQELVQAHEELERSNQELEQFAYVASHDLQEPLRMVTGHLQLLERRLGERLEDTEKKSLGFAVDGARRMAQLINALLTYGRVSKAPLVRESVDLGAVVQLIVQDHALSIEEKGADVRVEDLPIVQAPPSLLGIVLENLVSNALKFASERKPVVTVRGSESSSGWRVEVEDNGIGIEERHVERIFGVFERLHQRSRFPGTGIGLAVCRRIMERLGGSIGVRSRPGEGSVFWIEVNETSEEEA